MLACLSLGTQAQTLAGAEKGKYEQEGEGGGRDGETAPPPPQGRLLEEGPQLGPGEPY